MFCSKCATYLKEEFRFCTNCGQERPEQGPQQGAPAAATVQKWAAPTLDEYLSKMCLKQKSKKQPNTDILININLINVLINIINNISIPWYLETKT